MIQVLVKGFIRFVKFIFKLTVTLALIAACIYVDARYIEPKLLKVEEVTMDFEDVPWKQPLNIVVFSDTHLGPHYSVQDLQSVVNRINTLSPDLIIFTGDLIDDHATYQETESASLVLAELKATYGKYAVYGNHDHGGNGTRRYAKIMKDSGFTLLKNTHEEITLSDGHKLTLIGIDDALLGSPDVNKAFKGSDEESFRIFISHAPDVADAVLDRQVDLQLSGHTHGGQVRIPFLGAPYTVQYGEKYIKGLYTLGDEGQTKLYVTSGIGTSHLPYRFFNPPEIVKITI